MRIWFREAGTSLASGHQGTVEEHGGTASARAPKGPLPLGHPYLHLYTFCIKAFRTNVVQPLDRDGTSAGRGGCDL